MVVNKKKSSTGRRGSRTHGWGHHKRHRGAGNRGGRGNSNRGKRGQSRKPSHREERKGATKVGFTSHKQTATVITVTLATLQQTLDALVQQGRVKMTGDTYVVDGQALGFTKVLGSGRLIKKLKVSGAKFTERAKEKIAAAGGSVVEQAAAAPAKEEASA